MSGALVASAALHLSSGLSQVGFGLAVHGGDRGEQLQYSWSVVPAIEETPDCRHADADADSRGPTTDAGWPSKPRSAISEACNAQLAETNEPPRRHRTGRSAVAQFRGRTQPDDIRDSAVVVRHFSSPSLLAALPHLQPPSHSIAVTRVQPTATPGVLFGCGRRDGGDGRWAGTAGVRHLSAYRRSLQLQRIVAGLYSTGDSGTRGLSRRRLCMCVASGSGVDAGVHMVAVAAAAARSAIYCTIGCP